MNRQDLQQRTLGRTMQIVAALMVVMMVMVGGRAVAQAQGDAPLTLRLEAPAQVAVGEVIRLQLRVDGDSSAIGGFEAWLLYAPDAAETAGFAPAQPQAAGMGRLFLPEMASGSVVGAYGCGTAACLAQRSALARAAVSEAGVLAEVEVLGRAAGRLEVRLGAVQVVDEWGQRLAYELAQDRVVVQVGEGEELHAAPVWAWPVGEEVAEAAVRAADVTGDGVVAHNDVMAVALAWQVVREGLGPCGGVEAAADLNGDGCVDIADVQSAAALASQLAPEPPTGTERYLPLTPRTEAGPAAVEMAAASDVMTWTVDSTLDEWDTNANDGVCRTPSGGCTLRAAIQQANTHTGDDVIVFAIPGDGVHTIQLTERLPALWDMTGGTLIDGYSQPGAVPNSDPVLSNAQIRVEIRGQGMDEFDGLPITSARNQVQGLAFYNLRRSIWIYGSGAVGNVIRGNFIGTNAAASFTAASVTESQAHGIHVEQGAYRNRIGGTEAADRNVISGNARHGVGFWHVGTDENTVYNNIVGLSPDGMRRMPNRQQGVDVNYGASFNVIGGLEPGQRNVISGNAENGAEITHGEETTGNEIRGNYIGTDVNGETAAVHTSNGGVGVSLHDRIMDNLVADNVIGNNRAGGIIIDNFGNCCVRNNRIERNRIGISLTGEAIGNGVFGMRVLAMQSRIGPGNLIAYNPVGIQIEEDDSDGNTITENSIFSNTGLGIDLAPIGQINMNDEGDVDTGPNQQLNFPVLEAASPDEVSGRACAGCRVEVFIADRKSFQFGQGQTLAGAGMADDNGTFTLPLEDVAYGDFLTATATDVDGNTSEFSRNFVVSNPANSAPVAADDTATTRRGTPVVIDVLANDTDPEDDELIVADVDTPANGVATIDGVSVVYTPTVDFAGSDSFTYTASDNIGGASVATVTVTVSADIEADLFLPWMGRD